MLIPCRKQLVTSPRNSSLFAELEGMLMPMRRAVLVFVLLVAAAIAVEPLIHTHPLTQTSNAPCAVCVASVGSLTVLNPVPAAPLTQVTTIAATPAAAII